MYVIDEVTKLKISTFYNIGCIFGIKSYLYRLTAFFMVLLSDVKKSNFAIVKYYVENFLKIMY